MFFAWEYRGPIYSHSNWSVAFKSCSSLTSVELPEGLLTIGDDAFSGCSSLETISIPSSVTEIGEDAFWYCTRLTNVYLAEGIHTIAIGAFRGCESLESICIPSPAIVVSAFPTKVSGRAGFQRVHYAFDLDLERNGRVDRTTVRMVVSKYVKNMSCRQLAEVERKIEAILGGRLSFVQSNCEKLQRIRGLFANLEWDDCSQEGGTDISVSSTSTGQLELDNHEHEAARKKRKTSDDGSNTKAQSDALWEEKIQQERQEKEALRRQLEEANAKLALAKSPEVVDLTEDGPESAGDSTGQGPNRNDISNSPAQPKSALACMQIKQEAVLAKEAAEERALLAEERMVAAEKEAEAIRIMLAEALGKVDRHGQKESLLSNLASHNTELRPSSIHGIGVFATAPIPKGSKLFQYNGEPSSRTCGLSAEEVGSLPEPVQHILQKFILHNEEDGLYHVPEHGLSCALGVSYYLNSAEGPNLEPNVEFGIELDSSGLAEIVATRDIAKDEELLLSYEVNSSKTRRRQRKRRLFGRQNILAMAVKAATNNGATKPAKTLHMCGECEACVRDDCGECKHCLDMPKFGGKGTRKQKCLLRRCLKRNQKKGMEKAKAGRRSSRLKAIARFESMSFAAPGSDVHCKIGEGFSCPQCTATCSYDAKKCTECQLACYYEEGLE